MKFKWTNECSDKVKQYRESKNNGTLKTHTLSAKEFVKLLITRI